MADLTQKIKQFLKILTTPEIYTAILLILVGAASFGLGRLSALEESKPPVRILGNTSAVAISGSVGEAANKETIVEESEQGDTSDLAAGGKYVGSKNGSKYHFPWCSGAKRIAENNKVWFNSIEEARAAGYKPAANCKGLE